MLDGAVSKRSEYSREPCAGLTGAAVAALPPALSPLETLNAPKRGSFLSSTAPQISPKALDLIRANPSMYCARVLRGTVNQKERVILLLGESHVKGEKASDIGAAILSEFKHVGVEGAVSSRSGGILERLLTLPIDAFLWAQSRLAKGLRGSTIDDARTMQEAGYEKINYAALIHDQAMKHKLPIAEIAAWPDFATIPFKGEMVPVSSLPNQEFRFGNTVVPWREIHELALEMAAQEQSRAYSLYFEKREDVKRTYHLEAGYRCGLVESVPFAFQLSLFAMPVIGMAEHAITGRPSWAVAALGVGAMVQIAGFVIGQVLPERAQDNPWYGCLSGVFHCLNIRRDPVMANNIERMFEQSPKCTEAIAVVGAMHVGPLANLLRSKGWVQEEAIYSPRIWSRLSRRRR